MFTGIVEETGNVIQASSSGLKIAAAKVLQGTKEGDSIDVNGVCLTVTSLDEKSFSVDVMPETLKRTNLGQLKTGDIVNLERAMALGGRLGGHMVQGHIDTIGRILSLLRQEDSFVVGIEAPSQLMPYIVEKGFIAVDGISLTVSARRPSSFEVSIVAFTARNTNIARRRVGDTVNLEVDIIAKYVESLTGAKGSGITPEFLQDHGFMVS